MNYYNEIKEQLINNEVYKKAKDYSKNRSDLNTYYNVGKLLVEAQGGEERAKYGDGLIKEYSGRLTKEFGRGYSARNLKRMRKFYLYIAKGTAVMAQLSWTHYILLLTLNNSDEIKYYINISIKQNLSYRQLQDKIKNKEYERLSIETKNKLIEKNDIQINDFIKNPIVIKNNYNFSRVTEKLLKQLILENIESFMKELGEGYCYIDKEFKIKLGDRFNYIDLFLFNIKYNCYVVVELKVTELKKEHIGQIECYMNYVDKNIKTTNQDRTIGIIVCKKDNKYVIDYCSDPRIYRTEFILN